MARKPFAGTAMFGAAVLSGILAFSLFQISTACHVAPAAVVVTPGAEPVMPPPTVVDERNERDVIAAFTAAVPARLMASLAAPSVQPATTLADRQLSVVVVGSYGVSRAADQSFSCWVPDAGATVTSIESSRGAAWSALNVPGNQHEDLHGRRVTLPLVVKPGMALIVLSGSEGGNDIAPAQAGITPTGSAVDEAMVVVFTNHLPPAGGLRGPAQGSEFIATFLRTAGPMPDIDMALVPRVIDLDEVYRTSTPRPGDADRIDPNGWGAARPTFESVAKKLGGERRPDGTLVGGRFACCYPSDWLWATRMPWTQHQGYGTFYMAALSEACIMLHSKAPADPAAAAQWEKDRRSLALALVQRGIDQVGAFADLPKAKVLYVNGGHCWGPKYEIVLAGHLMRVEPFKWPTQILGRVFAEDWYSPGAWWCDNGSATDVGARWAFATTESHDGRQLANPPSTWGYNGDADHGPYGWAVRYMTQNAPAAQGVVVSAALMGLQENLNPAMVRFVLRQARGPLPAAAVAQLDAAGIVPHGLGFGDKQGYGMAAGLGPAVIRRYVPQ